MLDDNKPMKIEFENGSKIITIESGTNIRSKIKYYELESEEQHMKELVGIMNKGIEIINNSPRLDTIDINFPSDLFSIGIIIGTILANVIFWLGYTNRIF